MISRNYGGENNDALSVTYPLPARLN